ncbi:MAG: HAMP domain-containing sensor histidine kinase [Burkholderiaceae bacterium]
MIRSLRGRVVSLLACFGLLIALSLALIGYIAVRDYYTDVQYKRASEFAERLIDMHPLMWEEYSNSPATFGEKLSRYILYAPKIGLYLLDNEGSVLASAGDSQLFWSNYRVDLNPVREALQRDPDQPIFADDPDIRDQLCLVAARPVGRPDQPGQGGWLYVVARYASTDTAPGSLLRAYAIKTAGKIGLLTLGLGVILTMAIIALMTRPLSALTRVAERIRETGLDDSPPNEQTAIPHLSRHDEIGRLGRAFQEMLSRLRTEMSRVKQADNQRREMVASVSHDFRTPLTALTGQLETIKLKGESLDKNQRNQMIARAIHNAGHLKRLTDSLAEVASLDNPEFKAQPEPTALGELADDITQRFMPVAESRGVKLTADYPDALPLLDVDAGLIERAMVNLIDNALRVTPRGGSVRVAVRNEKNRLRVQVSDTGPGVSGTDQPHVFDLFYQTSQHRETRGSSGLGLSVVRRVAELHGGRAGLSSEPGQGSTFFIEIPASP